MMTPHMRRCISPARAAHKKGRMNRLESDYAAILAGRCACGELAGFWFEAVSLNLAPGLRCSYTPDFLVQRADGVLECHEVKGFWEDDARVKIKCAAEKYPFIFVAVTRPNKKTGWRYERFGQEEEGKYEGRSFFVPGAAGGSWTK